MVLSLLCAAAFGFGWVLRGLIALRDMRELEALRAAAASQREAEIQLLNRMAKS
jgi:hypothetical protein